MRRGQIYYVINENATGHEQRFTRPAIIVSNNVCNKYSPVVEIVYLSTQKKKPLPTHVKINSLKYPSIALCEHVFSVDARRLDNMVGECTEAEMKNINRALQISLGLVESW